MLAPRVGVRLSQFGSWIGSTGFWNTSICPKWTARRNTMSPRDAGEPRRDKVLMLCAAHATCMLRIDVRCQWPNLTQSNPDLVLSWVQSSCAPAKQRTTIKPNTCRQVMLDCKERSLGCVTVRSSTQFAKARCRTCVSAAQGGNFALVYG